jgi:geranylgeranyl transferase type-2 subunit beta
MTSSLYLDMLDEVLRPGIAGLSEQFTATQARFVSDSQRPDGGFGGRQGSSDLYYTDFALRALAWLAPYDAAFERAAEYLNRCDSLPRSIVECFNLLNVCRLLERCSTGTASRTVREFRPSSLIEWLCSQMLPDGGLARLSNDRVSAYHTFLGSLCFELLGTAMPAVDDAVHAIADLGRPDGGYAELADQAASQTSATAAAIAFLAMHDALAPEQMAGAVRFLAGMQSDEGGLRAHAAAPCGDLLSTFTGLLTLQSLGGFAEIDASGIARFLQRAAHSAGGFLACGGDELADVEYTYYGVGTLALLNLVVQRQGRK